MSRFEAKKLTDTFTDTAEGVKEGIKIALRK